MELVKNKNRDAASIDAASIIEIAIDGAFETVNASIGKDLLDRNIIFLNPEKSTHYNVKTNWYSRYLQATSYHKYVQSRLPQSIKETGCGVVVLNASNLIVVVYYNDTLFLYLTDLCDRGALIQWALENDCFISIPILLSVNTAKG